MKGQDVPAKAEIQAAIEQLSKSDRGRSALHGIRVWLDTCGMGLDQSGQAACLALFLSAWGPWSGTARDMIGAALEAQAAQKA